MLSVRAPSPRLRPLGCSRCTDQAAALLAAVQPGRSAGVEGASALVQALTAGPVVTARTAEEILVGVPAVAGSSLAVGVAILYSRGHRGQAEDRTCTHAALPKGFCCVNRLVNRPFAPDSGKTLE